MTAPALLTEAEAAEALRLCTRTLRKARQEGRLTYVLIGRAVRYTMSDLDTFISEARQDNRRCEPATTTRRAIRRKSATIVPFSQRN